MVFRFCGAMPLGSRFGPGCSIVECGSEGPHSRQSAGSFESRRQRGYRRQHLCRVEATARLQSKRCIRCEGVIGGRLAVQCGGCSWTRG